MSIDPRRLLEAFRATEFHRSQVQGFLYPVAGGSGLSLSAGRKDGVHTVRDCLKPRGEQVIWREADPTGERYDELHAAMMDQILLYQYGLVSGMYARLEAEDHASPGPGTRTDNRARARIEAIARLKNGWCDGEGLAITPAALQAAHRLAAVLRPDLYSIFPHLEGGILFEADEYPEFEIDASGALSVDLP